MHPQARGKGRGPAGHATLSRRHCEMPPEEEATVQKHHLHEYIQATSQGALHTHHTVALTPHPPIAASPVTAGVGARSTTGARAAAARGLSQASKRAVTNPRKARSTTAYRCCSEHPPHKATSSHLPKVHSVRLICIRAALFCMQCRRQLTTPPRGRLSCKHCRINNPRLLHLT